MKKLLSILFLGAFAYSCNGPGDESAKKSTKDSTREEILLTAALKKAKKFPDADSCTFDYKHPDHPDIPGKQLSKFSKKLRIEEAMGGVKRGNKPVYGSDPVITTTTSGASVILLDFWGGLISGTMWNVYGDFTVIDAGLAQAEIDAVVTKVKKDFDTFNVVVTTDKSVYDKTISTKRIRVYITQSNEWYGSGAGGVANLNSFFNGTAIVFVFSKLYGYNTHKIAGTCSHESGHTVGCRHQVDCLNGVIVNGYRYGCIMGNNVDSPTAALIVGTNAAACQTQDDFAKWKAAFGLK